MSNAETKIVADAEVPAIHMYRNFQATPAQLIRAHTDPDLFVQWIGPDRLTTTIDYWDARPGGSWRYVSVADGLDHPFRGCFHDITDTKIVQTFTWEGQPDSVALETLTMTDNGDGTTTLHAVSLCDSFPARDAWLSSGMESGVNEGYRKIDGMLADGLI